MSVLLSHQALFLRGRREAGFFAAALRRPRGRASCVANASCAAPFPADVTPREAFVMYPGGGAPRKVHIVFGFPLGVPVTIVEDAR